jgi:hypothetical protein
MWHLHLLCELSHTLYFMLMSNVKFVLVLTWSRSIYYNCSILHLAFCVGKVCWDLFHDEFIGYSPYFLFYGLDHRSYGLGSKERKRFHVDALVTTHVCFIMVFVSHVDMTFSWMVSTHAVRLVAMVVQIFSIMEHVQWVFLIYGRHVVCACDRWWLFSLLWLLCLGHMCIDLCCCLSDLCLL